LPIEVDIELVFCHPFSNEVEGKERLPLEFVDLEFSDGIFGRRIEMP
jgi:hypothetical protein